MGRRGGLAAWAQAVAVAVAIFSLCCHGPPKLNRVRAIAAFDQTALDFGAVPVGTWRMQQARVRNVGYVAFSVESLQVAGNPSYQIDLKGGRLMPGEEGTVTVRFHPLQEGELAEAVSVETDADENPVHQLKVKGLGLPALVRIEPSQLDFETLGDRFCPRARGERGEPLRPAPQPFALWPRRRGVRLGLDDGRSELDRALRRSLQALGDRAGEGSPRGEALS